MYFFPNNIQIEKLIVCNDLTKVIGSRNLSRKTSGKWWKIQIQIDISFDRPSCLN